MTHYERLGVARDATSVELRSAYRSAARRHHPDQAGDASAADMAAVNEAYRVLSDPASRRRYDATLEAPAEPRPAAQRADDRLDRLRDAPVHHPPGRFPWRFLLVMGALAIAVVIVGAILTDPAPEPVIDNVLRSGDCVELSVTMEAAEVACSGPHDAVVDSLIPFDRTCPTGTEAYRDRQGMGTACVVRTAPGTSG